MDAPRFDAITKALGAEAASRRAALRLATGGALGAALAGLGWGEAVAGCRADGERCRRGRQCCSGVCKRGTCRRRRGQGTCTIRADGCAGDFVTCNGGSCQCFVTAKGASFCGGSGIACAEGGICASNRDCVPYFGPGAACVRTGTGCCAGALGPTGCVPPCPTPS